VTRGACLRGRTLYTIRVSISGSSSEHFVEQSYSGFLRLHECLRPQWTDSDMPSMPPKSVVRRALMPSFGAERERLLSEFLRAAENHDFRSFLGLDPTDHSQEVLGKIGFVGCYAEGDGDSNASFFADGYSNRSLLCSVGSCDPDDDDVSRAHVPGSFEIIQRLDEMRAMNAALEEENAMIAKEVTSL